MTLVSIDITAMFPSIDNEMGIGACREYLDNRSELFPSTDCIIDALSITLTNNISYFNNTIYRQCKGTAMGPSHACSYADIAMSVLDNIINSSSLYIPFIGKWVRLRDDIFLPWLGTIDQLLEFGGYINALHPNIHFKLIYSKESVEYLDCKIYKSNNKLQTTLYSKPSDTHAYLVPTSCHPTHIVRNIPYGVAIRCKRICSEASEYEKHTVKFMKFFESRGYNRDFIHKEFQRANLRSRNSLLNMDLDIGVNTPHTVDNVNNVNNVDTENIFVDNVNTSRNFPLVVDYNPKLPNISEILNKYKHILDLDPELKNVINRDKIFGSFRKCKTLGDILICSRYPKIRHSIADYKGSVSCGRCTLCMNYLCATNVIKSPHISTEYRIQSTITCLDDYVVYFILDKLCGKGYVGRTENNLRSRWSTHKNHIKIGYTKCKVATHWKLCPEVHSIMDVNIDDSLPSQISITLIDKVIKEPWDTADTLFTKLCKKEQYWQNQLNTLTSSGGLNVRDERNILQKRTSKK